MTEAEWLRCRDPKRMLLFARDRVSNRRLRLCWCGCCWRDRWERDAEIVERAARVGDRSADGLPVTAEEFTEAMEALSRALESAAEVGDRRTRLIEAMFCLGDDPLRMYTESASRTGRLLSLPMRFAFWLGGGWWPKSRRLDADIWCMVIRCVVGNPFRPATLAASWRTGTVLTLARQMYEARDFDVMPILADALQDAECDNEEILDHCRDTNREHVRGCWVVDLLLGKES